MPSGSTIDQHPRGSEPPGSLPLCCALSNEREIPAIPTSGRYRLAAVAGRCAAIRFRQAPGPRIPYGAK
jgi:hypothetical protein